MPGCESRIRASGRASGRSAGCRGRGGARCTARSRCSCSPARRAAAAGSVLLRVGPHIARGPAGNRRHARDRLSARQPERLFFLEVGARRRLVAAQRREPGVVALERREQRLDLVALAAGLGAFGLPEPDARRRRAQVDQIESPALRQLVAVGQRLRRSDGTCRGTAPGCPAAPRGSCASAPRTRPESSR